MLRWFSIPDEGERTLYPTLGLKPVIVYRSYHRESLEVEDVNDKPFEEEPRVGGTVLHRVRRY